MSENFYKKYKASQETVEYLRSEYQKKAKYLTLSLIWCPGVGFAAGVITCQLFN